MRTQKEMFDLIIGTAKKEELIRGVILNGSRANPNAAKDIFQDYDIIYIVKETADFIKNRNWINVFGEELIFQLPDEMDALVNKPTSHDECYGYLMQFTDKTRIDLRIQTLDRAIREIKSDSLSIILLDKDNLLPTIGIPNDSSYWIGRPTSEQFNNSCNEFWWVFLYIAKGLWRDEILYSLDCLNSSVRPELFKLLTWYVGATGIDGFACSVGKSGKYLKKYLPENIWQRYLKTYPPALESSVWDAIFIMAELFEEIAIAVAEKLDFCYNFTQARNSFDFAKTVKLLPKDAENFAMIM